MYQNGGRKSSQTKNHHHHPHFYYSLPLSHCSISVVNVVNHHHHQTNHYYHRDHLSQPFFPRKKLWHDTETSSRSSRSSLERGILAEKEKAWIFYHSKRLTFLSPSDFFIPTRPETPPASRHSHTKHSRVNRFSRLSLRNCTTFSHSAEREREKGKEMNENEWMSGSKQV